MRNRQVLRAKASSFSPWITLAGVIVLLVGLAWDAALHAADPDLAAEEGIFTLSNPGHVLFGAGIAVIVAGSLAFLYGRYEAGGRLAAIISAAGLLALGGTSLVAAMSVDGGLGGGGHSHDEAAVAHEHMEPDAGDTAEHAHEEGEEADDGHEVHGTSDPRAEEELYGRSLRDAARFADFAVAEAAGFEQITRFRYGTWGSAHFRNVEYQVDGVALDSERPENLVYIKTKDGRMILAGVMYVSHTARLDLDAGLEWHTHENGCVTSAGPPVVKINGICPPGSLQISDQTAMLHVWFFNNPDGLLAHFLTDEAIEIALAELG